MGGSVGVNDHQGVATWVRPVCSCASSGVRCETGDRFMQLGFTAEPEACQKRLSLRTDSALVMRILDT